jgi:hypothetical protein
MQIDGQCLCGHIRYEAEIDPAAVIICHCTDCQTHSATAFRYGVLVKSGDFRLISGELRRYIKTGDSGRQRALSFCPDCGTSIHGGDADDAQILSLRLGTARQRHELVPRAQIWRRSALGWLGGIDEIEAFETQPQGDRFKAR